MISTKYELRRNLDNDSLYKRRREQDFNMVYRVENEPNIIKRQDITIQMARFFKRTVPNQKSNKIRNDQKVNKRKNNDTDLIKIQWIYVIKRQCNRSFQNTIIQKRRKKQIQQDKIIRNTLIN
ncbi:unnamed protein product [Paramecium sonneborni]|uniref:Uncharacterized protein n=1 Tax=Paramecium sonneborni TaxID=65129 RepID=A0A8S1RP50_9CILI|nr:unnamed protein product [Paramecium sonneborni]